MTHTYLLFMNESDSTFAPVFVSDDGLDSLPVFIKKRGVHLLELVREY